jgi:hypothetical protein
MALASCRKGGTENTATQPGNIPVKTLYFSAKSLSGRMESNPRMQLGKLDDETMTALWDDAWSILNRLVSSKCIAKRFLDLSRGKFLSLLAERPFDVLECVAVPALRAWYFALRLRIRREFYLHIAASAFRA